MFHFQHKRRHLNPFMVDYKSTKSVVKKKAVLKDINVQFFPCKICGAKFPSYYFVHKHKKMWHAEEESQPWTQKPEEKSQPWEDKAEIVAESQPRQTKSETEDKSQPWEKKIEIEHKSQPWPPKPETEDKTQPWEKKQDIENE